MREPPRGIGPEEIAAALRTHWGFEVATVEHLAVGFGAHHWRARGERDVFVTLDTIGAHHTAESLENAYAAAAALELDLVVASLPTRDQRFTVPLGPGRLSCTPWVAGEPVDSVTVADLADLARLHACRPPARIPHWRPVVGPDLATRLERLSATPWRAGPYGERARTMIMERLAAIADWAATYHRLAVVARTRPWVPAHGEPHARNQLLTPDGTRFVDWESLRLAPRERDHGPLRDAGLGDALRSDPDMLAMFDLEWRLDEISQYADWLAAPHTGTADDAIAFEGLVRELQR